MPLISPSLSSPKASASPVSTPVMPAVASSAAPSPLPTQTAPMVEVPLRPLAFTPSFAGSVLAAGVSALGARAASLAVDPYALVPANAGDAVSLADLLRALPKTPKGEAFLEQLVARVQGALGITVPVATLQGSLQHPEVVLQAMTATPGAIALGFDALNLAHKAGRRMDTAPQRKALDSGFDLQNIDVVDVPLPQGSQQEIFPGIYGGHLAPDDIADIKHRRNAVLAEVFDRLSTPPLEGETPFSTVYDGINCTSVAELLKALVDAGHTVEATFEQRIAEFSPLYIKGADDELHVVPNPVMVRTGVVDSLGREAIVPANHAEIYLRIRPGAETNGPPITADVAWFQGMGGVGFSAAQSNRVGSWAGFGSSAPLSQDQSIDVVLLAAVYGDVVRTIAREQDLGGSGYGITGVCNDIALLERAVTGTTEQFPLLHRDDVLLAEINRRLDAGDPDSALLLRLKENIVALESDIEPPTTDAEIKDRARRAQASITSQPGDEAFTSTAVAQEIFAEVLGR